MTNPHRFAIIFYMNTSAELLLNAVKSKLHGLPCDVESLPKTLALAKRHSVLNMIAEDALKADLPEQVRAKLLSYYAEFLRQQESLAYAAEILFAKLEEKNIPYMPLKGYYLKKLYPDPLLRSCCDLDVWFDPARTQEVKKLMDELGFELKSSGENHMFHTLGTASVEMHYSLGKVPSCPDYYDDVLPRLKHVSGSLYNFTDEDFYIFVIVHLYKHFKSGGTGIRSVADVYLYNEKKTLEREYLQREFEKLQLVTFEEKLRALSFRWFGGGELPENDPLADYILSSGVYGTVKNATVNGAAKHGKRGYFFKRAFPEVATMKKIFPVLEKCILLLPFCYMWRLIKAIFTKPQAVKSSLSSFKSADDEAVAKANELFNDLGI